MLHEHIVRLTAYEKDLNRIKMGDKIQFILNVMYVNAQVAK